MNDDGDIADYLDDTDPSGDDRAGKVLSAIAVIGAEVGELRAYLGDLAGDTGTLREDVAGLKALAGQVTDLAASVEQLLGQDQQAEGPPQPTDLAHIPLDQQADELERLAVWVQQTLHAGWPWVQERLRPCWPLHPALVNDLLLLRSTYQTAYDDKSGRAHHGIDFRHLLDYVIDAAERLTRDCADVEQGETHDVPPRPRNDLSLAKTGVSLMVLARVHWLTEQANRARTRGAVDLAEQAQHKAAALFEQYGITREVYESYERRLRHSEERSAARAAAHRDRPDDTD